MLEWHYRCGLYRMTLKQHHCVISAISLKSEKYMKSPQDYINLLPGVPIVESPFFEEICKGGYFTEEEEAIAVQLHSKGYAVLDFPDAEIHERAERIKNNLTPHFQPYVDGTKTESPTGMQINNTRFQDAFQIDKDVTAIATNERVIHLLDRLYGRKCFPFQTLNFRVGTQQHIHSDAVHFNSHPERFMCGVWVALEDITPENGPLKYHPGSHKFTHYYNAHIGYDVSRRSVQPHQALYHDIWNALVEKYNCPVEHFFAKKGQALIWSAHLLHGGEIVLDKSASRWSQVTHYFFENCSYFTPMMSNPFAGKILFRRPANIVARDYQRNYYLGIPQSLEYIRENLERVNTWEVVLPKDFDPERYCELHPDVQESGLTAEQHFLQYGYHKARKYK